MRAVAVTAARGQALLSVVDGRLPRGDQDIMLGATTLRSLGSRAGDTVQVTVNDPVTGAARTTPFRITGRASFAPSFGTGGFGTGAALTVSALLHAQCPDGGPACLRKAQQGLIYSVLVHAVPGPSGDWIRVDQVDEGLDISIDTAGTGALSGSVGLKGPAGETMIAIDVDLAVTHPAPPAQAGLSRSHGTCVCCPPARSTACSVFATAAATGQSRQ